MKLRNDLKWAATKDRRGERKKSSYNGEAQGGGRHPVGKILGSRINLVSKQKTIFP